MKFTVGITDDGQTQRRRLVSAAFIEALGNEAKRLVLERTSEGIDEDGAAFSPYSERWKKERERQGRDGSRPDLNFTGDMLRALGVDTDAATGTATVSFSGNATEGEKAYFHEVAGAGKARVKRRFMGLSEGAAQRIEGLAGALIERALNNG